MISLKKYHTFHFDIFTDHLISIASEESLLNLYLNGFFTKENFLILGGGSNLFFQNNFKGTILLSQIKKRIVSNYGDDILISFGSGENWHEVVQWTVSNGYYGLENLSLIPGTVGAAPIQNIGAYGVELKDVFYSLTAFNLLTGLFEHFSLKDCNFGYRESVFKKNLKGIYFITEVTLKLSKNPKVKIAYGDVLSKLKNLFGEKSYTPHEVSSVIIDIRKSKLPDPLQLGNAGSFFKNPIVQKSKAIKLKENNPEMPIYDISDDESKIAAAWLIEHAGFKGKREGDIGCYPHQALVLVHYGNGKPSDLISFYTKIQHAVFEHFGIFLEPEVNQIL